MERYERTSSIKPVGVLATACRQRGPAATREVPAVIAAWINWQLPPALQNQGAPKFVSEFIVWATRARCRGVPLGRGALAERFRSNLYNFSYPFRSRLQLSEKRPSKRKAFDSEFSLTSCVLYTFQLNFFMTDPGEITALLTFANLWGGQTKALTHYSGSGARRCRNIQKELASFGSSDRNQTK